MLFFGAATGRCGTMTLANLLTAEEDVVCLHEGQLRRGEEAVGQWLPFLTLQNVLAYHHPDRAQEIFEKARSRMPKLLAEHNLFALGDIAYNNPPFVGIIPKVFPDAKLIVIFRDGRDFVRSANAADGPDPAPVGWSGNDCPHTKRERFIAFGRLRPKDSEDRDSEWQSMTPLDKNAWLWSETNRLILEGLPAWKSENVFVIRFEAFFANPVGSYAELRNFLGLDGPPPAGLATILSRPLNQRAEYTLSKWHDWPEQTHRAFTTHAGEMMQRLGYL